MSTSEYSTVDTVKCENFKPDVRIGFILMDRFTLHPVAELIDPIRFASDTEYESRQIFCQWEWMTWNNEPVISSCGLCIHPTSQLNLHTQWDYIVIAGGLLKATLNPTDDMLDAIRRLHARKIPIITLDSSSFVVARTGLLDGKRCAIHFTTRDEFQKRFPQVTPVLDHTYVSDGGIISCPGGTSIELSVDIIRRHCGEKSATKAMKYMMTESMEEKRSPVGSDRLDNAITRYEIEAVERTINYMKSHLSSRSSLQDITALMKVPLRQLNQAFLQSTGDTAAVHWRKLRLAHARTLMTNSSASIDDIAAICGFSNASHLISWFRKQYGETPAGYRKRRREVERLSKKT
jgi:transcriptional regulator GlxA family with amidase domain